jgi:TolA-binding protein
MEVSMKRFSILLVGLLTLGSWGRAEEAKPTQDLAAYLEQMQVKLEHTAQRANQPSSSGSSVVGLRGSKQESASKQLYWKGKTGAAPVTTEEVKMFRTAIEQAKAGQKDVAVATLKSFVEKYPKSGLIGDANDTLALLTAGPAIATPLSPAKS